MFSTLNSHLIIVYRAYVAIWVMRGTDVLIDQRVLGVIRWRDAGEPAIGYLKLMLFRSQGRPEHIGTKNLAWYPAKIFELREGGGGAEEEEEGGGG